MYLSNGLYLICSEKELRDKSKLEQLKAFSKMPFSAMQLRIKKTGHDYLKLLGLFLETLSEASFPLFLNDSYYYAKKTGFDGAHFGQDDWLTENMSLSEGDFLIGFSTHNFKQFLAAQEKQIYNYLGFGPFFSTNTKEKLDPFIERKEALKVQECLNANSGFCSVFSIGGITLDNYSPEIHGKGVALYSNIWNKDRPLDSAETWIKKLNS